MMKKKIFRKWVIKYLPVISFVLWAVVISLLAIVLTSCGIPEGYKKDVVWHRVTIVEVVGLLATVPPFERYKISIDDTIDYVSSRKYVVGDSIPFIYITPSYTVK